MTTCAGHHLTMIPRQRIKMHLSCSSVESFPISQEVGRPFLQPPTRQCMLVQLGAV